MSKKKLLVIGGGAAGFFCAVNAARLNTNLQVTIIEKSNKLLSKVKVSGGGRCNVTHACYSIAEMIKKYPRGSLFLKKAFHHFFTTDTINWFNERGVILNTESDGRIFPATNNSQTIIDCLINEANKYGIEILLHNEVIAIEKNQLASNSINWLVKCKNKNFNADFICIASGGYPKITQFDWLKNTTHLIENPVPSLFTFNLSNHSITSLMGVVVENISIKIVNSKINEQGTLLITHWGFSGPAILKLSAWAAKELAIKNWQFSIVINWVPNYNENTLRLKMQQIRFELASQKICNRNPFLLPNRLWEYLLTQSNININIRWADLPAKEQNKLIKNLSAHQFDINGKTTFKEEFVTAGGISLTQIDYNTMQSKINNGLYFAGEILDIDGITGGFNFQNAWTTGFIAAKAISDF